MRKWDEQAEGVDPPKSDTPGNPLNPIESSEIQRWTGMYQSNPANILDKASLP